MKKTEMRAYRLKHKLLNAERQRGMHPAEKEFIKKMRRKYEL